MPEPPKPKGADQRSQRRIEAALPVQVRGMDAEGVAFEELTEAVEVSRRGLSILTSRNLPMLAAVTVVIPGRGPKRPGERPEDFFANASVVRVVKDGEMNRVSIRFIGATLNTYSSEA
jgi:hypothetical protein